MRPELSESHAAIVSAVVEPLNEIEAARRLGLKVATLRAWRRKGRGPAYVRLGRAVRYLSSDLDDFIRANRHASSAVM